MELGLNLSLSRSSRGGSSSVDFDPSQLFANGETGAWWDGLDSATLLDASFAPADLTEGIARWMDKSGNGFNIEPPAVINRPVRSVDGVAFDGTDDHFRMNTPGGLAITGDVTVALVVIKNNPSRYDVFVACQQTASSNSPYEVRANNEATPTVNFGSADATAEGDGSGTAKLLVGSKNVVIAQRDVGATVSFDINGAQTSAAHTKVPTVGTAAFYMGCRSGPQFYLGGTICECIILNRLLTPAEQTNLKNYLGAKHA